MDEVIRPKEVQIPLGATLELDGKPIPYTQSSNEYRLAMMEGSPHVYLQRLERGMTLDPLESFERWVSIPIAIIPTSELFQHDKKDKPE